MGEREARLKDDLIARWADLLVDYCLRVTPGESVLIGSEWAARPLVEACYKAVVLREAFPLIRLDFPGLSRILPEPRHRRATRARALGRPL